MIKWLEMRDLCLCMKREKQKRIWAMQCFFESSSLPLLLWPQKTLGTKVRWHLKNCVCLSTKSEKSLANGFIMIYPLIWNSMPHRSDAYIQLVIDAIQEYQFEELMSDRELSLAAWMSATMVSKIKKWTTVPKLSTLRKLKILGVAIPKPTRQMVDEISA